MTDTSIARWTANFTPPNHEYGPVVTPIANFTATPVSGTAPLTVQFNDTSENWPTSWSWDFGDGDSTNATVQDPVHMYASAGTYTVSLTATNSAGSDEVEKAGFVEVTAPISNQATNVAGRTMHQAEIEYAANKQQLMDYSPSTYVLPDADTIKTRLPNDHIFFFTGHGDPGMIQIRDESPSAIFSAANTSDGNNFNDASSSYYSMDLAVFLGCKTGATDNIIGNLVDVVTSKGASCAIGWTENILDQGPDEWSSTFWDQIQEGKSIMSAYDEGIVAAAGTYWCSGAINQFPDGACNLTKNYSVGNSGACSQPLPGALSRIDITQNTVKTTKSSTLASELSKEKQKQIKNNVSTFAKVPEKNFTLTDVIQTSYADLYEIKSGESTYWVNSNNGRVQSLIISETGLKTKTQIIDLDQGSVIAESYAKDKFPELWNLSKFKGIKQTMKTITDRGSDQTFDYSWQEFFTSSLSNTPQSSEIPGSNFVTIRVSPYTGHVIYYNEKYIPFDSAISLSPSVNQDEARQYAISFFQQIGFGIPNPDEITCSGLSMSIDKDFRQHLTWSFELNQKGANGFQKSGFVNIDAHNGEVVWYNTIT